LPLAPPAPPPVPPELLADVVAVVPAAPTITVSVSPGVTGTVAWILPPWPAAAPALPAPPAALAMSTASCCTQRGTANV
jgi:hypothetical protein